MHLWSIDPIPQQQGVSHQSLLFVCNSNNWLNFSESISCNKNIGNMAKNKQNKSELSFKSLRAYIKMPSIALKLEIENMFSFLSI